MLDHSHKCPFGHSFEECDCDSEVIYHNENGYRFVTSYFVSKDGKVASSTTKSQPPGIIGYKKFKNRDKGDGSC